MQGSAILPHPLGRLQVHPRQQLVKRNEVEAPSNLVPHLCKSKLLHRDDVARPLVWVGLDRLVSAK